MSHPNRRCHSVQCVDCYGSPTLPITFPPTERTVVRIVTPGQAQVVDHMKGYCHQGKGCLLCEQAQIIVDLKRRLDSFIEG